MGGTFSYSLSGEGREYHRLGISAPGPACPFSSNLVVRSRRPEETRPHSTAKKRSDGRFCHAIPFLPHPYDPAEPVQPGDALRGRQRLDSADALHRLCQAAAWRPVRAHQHSQIYASRELRKSKCSQRAHPFATQLPGSRKLAMSCSAARLTACTTGPRRWEVRTAKMCALTLAQLTLGS